MPIEQDDYDLTAQEFRDALAVRYKKPLLSIPLIVVVVALPLHWIIF